MSDTIYIPVKWTREQVRVIDEARAEKQAEQPGRVISRSEVIRDFFMTASATATESTKEAASAK